MRLYRPPGCGATCPSSSRISSIEAIDSLFKPVRSIKLSTLAGSKASASNRILYSLSNTGPAPGVPREVGRARSLADLVDYVRGAHPATELAATIELPARGLVFPGHVAGDLPASRLDALLAENDTSSSNAFAMHSDSFHPMGAVITGSATLELHVRAAPRGR